MRQQSALELRPQIAEAMKVNRQISEKSKKRWRKHRKK